MAAPEPLPNEEQKTAVALLEPELQRILKTHRVPWNIQKRVADRGFRTVGDFVELWDNKTELKKQAPRQFGYALSNPESPDANEEEKLQRYNVFLAQAYEAAHKHNQRHIKRKTLNTISKNNIVVNTSLFIKLWFAIVYSPQLLL